MERHVDAAHLLPYLVSKEYLAFQSPVESAVQSLGHGVHVALVFDVGGAVQNVRSQDLDALKLSWADARSRALANLERLAKRGAISMQLFEKGPAGQPFILAGGHWATATAILMPGLRVMAQAKLGTNAVCASIPHREAMLLFPCGTPQSRQAMRALVREKESDGVKPLTFGLFSLTESGIKVVQDD